MSANRVEKRWPHWKTVDGYIMRSIDVHGRTIGNLPRILGMDPNFIENSFGAIYGLKKVYPGLISAISIVGFNNDRDAMT